jgi:D-aminopeptidase
MKSLSVGKAAAVTLCLLLPQLALAQARPRARDLGIPFEGAPGPLNAITDVKGVEVGMATIIAGEGPLKVGAGPVRTGVTAVLPRGKASSDQVFAGWFSINGNGEMTGTTWIEEAGLLEGPVFITTTHSVGTVRDAAIMWAVRQGKMQQPWALPVVAETYDGYLNDINGFHVKPEHVFAALDGARGGPVAEGNVGGGTGMRCLGFKGGIGSASRVVGDGGAYTVGVLVQCNFGSRQDLRVAGVPVGDEITDLVPCIALDDPTVRPGPPRCGKEAAAVEAAAPEQGSIIVIAATDAPLLPHQLKRIATRVSLGIGRAGGFGGNSSGDIFLAFSTANPKAAAGEDVQRVEMLPNPRINALFYATVQATEEAILNAMLAARTMTGADGLRVHALPHDRLLAALRKYGRLQ